MPVCGHRAGRHHEEGDSTVANRELGFEAVWVSARNNNAIKTSSQRVNREERDLADTELISQGKRERA